MVGAPPPTASVPPSADDVIGEQGLPERERYKRPFDLAVIVVVALALLPVWVVLGVAIPVAIRLESPGPVLYRQRRLGRGGREFRIIKFRTMFHGAERRTGPVWAAPSDVRTTRVGRVLRRLHFDELPQVVNILRGEMSLVGPRPERPALAARFERLVPGFSTRLRVRPGVMGLAQALGSYHWHPRRKIRYDNFYIDKMGPWLDIKVCVLCESRRRARSMECREGKFGAGRRAPCARPLAAAESGRGAAFGVDRLLR